MITLPLSTEKQAPEISIIVPTYNRSASLLHTLTALSLQTMDKSRYEVIVVDDGSTDNTQQCVEQFAMEHPDLSVIYRRHQTNLSKSAACNTGIRLAHGNLVIITDDDIRPVEDWLEAHADRHRSEDRTVCVVGLVLYPEKWAAKSNWVEFANGNYRKNVELEHQRVETLPPNRYAGGNTSIPRKLLVSVGMVDEKLRRGEDVELGCRLHLLGVPLVFERKALVYHNATVIHSIEDTLRSFRRFYADVRPTMRNRYPWYFQKYGHWFLEPPDASYDDTRRTLAKAAVRIVARRPIQRIVVRCIRLVDAFPWLYWRPLYQYVLACEALDAIRVSEKTSTRKEDRNEQCTALKKLDR